MRREFHCKPLHLLVDRTRKRPMRSRMLQNSLYFSLLFGNLVRRRVGIRPRPPPRTLIRTGVSQSLANNPQFAGISAVQMPESGLCCRLRARLPRFWLPVSGLRKPVPGAIEVGAVSASDRKDSTPRWGRRLLRCRISVSGHDRSGSFSTGARPAACPVMSAVPPKSGSKVKVLVTVMTGRCLLMMPPGA